MHLPMFPLALLGTVPHLLTSPTLQQTLSVPLCTKPTFQLITPKIQKIVLLKTLFHGLDAERR